MSLGNYFNTDIYEGSYEINPPFDFCLIKNILIKSKSELDRAENNKKKLLFIYIISEDYYYKNKNLLLNKLQKYIKYTKVYNKNKFPYYRYSRNYKKLLVIPIVNTRIIICSTSYLDNNIKNNISKANNYIEEWIINKEEKISEKQIYG
jgi:LytS/YehU family sensor histidine kinase